MVERGTWIVFASAACTGLALAQDISNRDFAADRVGSPPADWRVMNDAFAVSVAEPATGERCLQFVPNGAGSEPGILMQSIDAQPYHRKVVRFRARARTDAASDHGRVQIWFRVDRPQQQHGFFDNMQDRPCRSRSWEQIEIIGRVSDDAVRLAFGVLVYGATAWVDDFSIEILGESVLEAPRPLSERGLANTVALTRLLGYVRYFHPSDEAAGTDWEQFAIHAMRELDGVADAAALATKLTELFETIAPTVQVYRSGTAPQLPDALEQKPAKLDTIAWRHTGVGIHGKTGVYHSERVDPRGTYLQRLFGTASSRRPTDVFRAELGGGVACQVPLVLYRGKGGTLPRAAPRPANASVTHVAATGEDRATRLAAVALGWNVFQHFYPYFDVVGDNWSETLEQTMRRAAIDKDPTEFLETLRCMIAALRDGHGHVGFDGEKIGAWPLTWDWIEGELVITHVDDSVQSLLARGEIVERVGGFSARQRLIDLLPATSGATARSREWRATSRMCSGTIGTSGTLGIRSADGAAREVELTYGFEFARLAEPRPPAIHELEDGVVYVDIGRISDDDMNGALARLQQARAIVFDFRGYPSTLSVGVLFRHIITEQVQSAHWHVPVTNEPDRREVTYERSRWPIRPADPYLKAVKVFVTDTRAVSYAETCLAIVEHYQLGPIVGETTAATNGNVNPFLLPGGYQVSWTGMRVVKHDGETVHHGIGIAPTVPAKRTIAGVRAGHDELLERALAVARQAMTK